MTKRLLLILFLLICGCAAQQAKPIETTPVPSDVIETIRTVYKTNWLAMPFIVGVALGVVLLIKGKVLDGLAIAGGSGAGLYALASYQAFATHRYAPWIAAVVVLVLGFGFIAWRLYVDRRAFREVVAGGERFKEIQKDFNESFGYAQNLNQNPSTKKLVKQAKRKLKKSKGE